MDLIDLLEYCGGWIIITGTIFLTIIFIDVIGGLFNG